MALKIDDEFYSKFAGRLGDVAEPTRKFNIIQNNMTTMKNQIEKILNQIRPSLQADGGDIDLVEVDEKNGIVKVKLVGACADCPMSVITLKEGVEKVLKEKISEVKEVVAV